MLHARPLIINASEKHIFPIASLSIFFSDPPLNVKQKRNELIFSSVFAMCLISCGK